MPTSETDIANTALRLIGATPITSFTDGSKSANTVSDLYAGLRDEVLRAHPWNFATRRAQLARSSIAPTFEFDYAYVLPSDWLRTVSVHDNDAGSGSVAFREEEVGNQGVICASVENLYLRYVYRATDPNRFSADFRRALEYSLARDMALPLASSNSMQEKYERMAERSLAKARSADAMGSIPERRPRGSWANSRHRGYIDDRWPR